MINVTYDRMHHSLKVEGHAGAGLKGSDPICAAVTILAYTFAQSCIDAVEFKCAKPKSLLTRFEDGYAEISVEPHKKYNEMVMSILDSIVNGFVLLAKGYKENLSLTVK